MVWTYPQKRNNELSIPVIMIAVALLILTISCENSSKESLQFYVGTYSLSTKPGIYNCELNLKSRQIAVLDATFGIENPSFLALSPNNKYLYAVSESAGFDGTGSGGVYAYRIDQYNKKLKLINSVGSGGAHPCHLSVHPSGRLIFVANYTGGNVASIRIKPDGGLNADIQLVQHLGSGPDSSRQVRAHAHSANVLTNGKFLYACDLGIDKVMGYQIDLNKAQLKQQDNATLSTAAGAGPRHLAFSVDSRFAFVINELNSTITICSVDTETGQLEILSSVSSLPAEIEMKNYCADIHVHPGGKFLYASNRGHNSIAVFQIGEKGDLTMVQTHSSLGDWPRNFTIDPSGKLLLVANQRSDNIVVLEINKNNGQLKDSGISLQIPEPVCIVFPISD